VGDDGSVKHLPARTGADVHLADAFGEPGCPLCRERERSESAYLESILAESVNDVGFRQGLDAGRGFCGRHAAAILDADRRRAGSLGAAILLRATLAPRIRELEAANAARGRARARRVGEAARPPACPACERVARSDAGRVESLVGLTGDPAWAEAAASAPLCLEHLLAVMAVRQAPPGWAAIEARQVERLIHLRDLLDGFSHTSSHDRRHRQTAAQRAAPDQASAVLAGGLASNGHGSSRARMAAPPAVAQVPADARAVLLTGVYGAGKSTTAIELVGRLGGAGAPAAAIDLDWLAWFEAPTDWDEHDDPRVGLANLAAMRATYLAVGVRLFILAGTVRTASHVAGLREALGMPLAVIRLDVPLAVIETRLRADANALRAEDLAVATADLASGAQAAMPADWVIDADRPVADVTDEVLERLGWSGHGAQTPQV
jgi:hypothetical protein